MNKTKKIDININLLKVLMCLGVVLAHTLRNKLYTSAIFYPFKLIQILAAPCFMFISFYFSYNVIFSKDIKIFKNRMIRLLIPHLIWTFVYFIILYPFIHPGFIEIIWQLFTGHSTLLNASMWFQINLIILTILFFIIGYSCDKKTSLCIFVILTIFSFVMQYTNINYNLFADLRFELSYPLGRIMEMIPYAGAGLLFRHFNLIEKFKKYRYPILLACLTIMYFTYAIESDNLKSFGYAGIIILILVMMIFIIFEMIPFELFPAIIKNIFTIISKYTLGIYCIHRLVFNLIQILLPQYATRTFVFSISIYLISYLICLLLDLIENKYIKMSIN